MLTLDFRNVHQALPTAFSILVEEGDSNDSRNRSVLEYYCPVVTTYTKPQERVGFWSLRDVNPFFHLFESLWMLAGRNDIEFPQKFNKNFGQYSDDGITFHGAYGHRWKKHFKMNQLKIIIGIFKENYLSRRVVLQMWDSEDVKDLPCNTHCYFWIRHRHSDPNEPRVLHMSVINRSNDIIFGCYGANAVHFSFLQEYLAQMIGVGMGNYIQFSNNWHCYTDSPIYRKLLPIIQSGDEWGGKDNPYINGEVCPMPLVTNPKTFDMDLEMFLEDPIFCNLSNTFLMRTAKPMYKAYEAFKGNSSNRVDLALDHIKSVVAPDWNKACKEWLERRHNLIKNKEN